MGFLLNWEVVFGQIQEAFQHLSVSIGGFLPSWSNLARFFYIDYGLKVYDQKELTKLSGSSSSYIVQCFHS